MRMVGWIECIKVEPEGIVWVDWKATERVRATWDEVTAMDDMTTYTRNGRMSTLRLSPRATQFERIQTCAISAG